MQNNNNNIAIADELDEITSILSRIDVEDTSDAIENTKTEIAYLDSVAQKTEAPELRALSHWMMLNIEVDSENVGQIKTLLEDGSYYNWMEILSNLLRQYDQSLLPQIYKSLTNPSWLVKPSAPLLRNLAAWIETTKTPENVSFTSSVPTETTDESVHPQLFEDVEIEVLEKSYEKSDVVENFNADSPQKLTETSDNYYDEIKTEDNSIDIELNNEYSSLIDETPATESNLAIEENNEVFVDEVSMPDESILISLSTDDDTNDFSDEADDILMTLTNISSTSDNVFDDVEKHISELQRFDMLAEISAFNTLLPISTWCQQNLKTFAKNQSDESRNFIESGESWSWIEYTKLALAEPEEISHIAALSAELSRDEWLDPLDVNALQELLLFLRNPTINNEDSLVSVVSDENHAAETKIIDKEDDSFNSEAPAHSLNWNDDVHPELLEVYFEETSENIVDLCLYLKGIETNTTTKEERQDARRTAHTIKGGSAVVGIDALSTLAHKLEMILDHAIDHALPDDANKLLINASSCLEELYQAILDKKPAPADFSITLSQMTSYAESLEDGDDSLELSPLALPDFITRQNTDREITLGINELRRKEDTDSTEEDSEASKEHSKEPTISEPIVSYDKERDADNQDNVEDFKIDDLIVDNTTVVDVDAATATNTKSLPTLSENEDLDDFTAELDDIVMTLVTTEVKVDKKPFILDAYIEELQRLDMLAEISGFPEVVNISSWYQENLKLIAKKSTKKLGEFISSGESWAWLELISASIADPKESSHHTALTNELTRNEWVKTLDKTDLQALLLVLGGSNTSSHAETDKETLQVETSPSQKDSKPSKPSAKKKIKSSKKTVSKPKKKPVVVKKTKTTTKKPTKKKTRVTTKKKAVKTPRKPVSKKVIPKTKIAKTQIINTKIVTWDEDVHPELLSVYLQETSEQITLIAALLHKISKGEANKEQQKQAARVAHTIKGASGVVGISEIVDFTHKLEDILDFAVNNKLPAETAELLAESSDCLESLFEAVQEKRIAPEEFAPILIKLTKYAASIEANDTTAYELIDLNIQELPDFISSDETKSSVDSNNTDSAQDSSNTVSTSLAASVDPATESHIRVPTVLINKLLNLAGELVTTSSQVSDKVENTLITSTQIKEQDKRVHRMLDELSNTIYKQEKDQVSMFSSMQNKQFDTLEMDTYNELHSVTSLLTESILDSETIESTLKQQLNEIHNDLRTLENLNKELSDTILSSRMESLNTLIPRLERIIRQTCRKTGKEAELIVTGNDINIDTDILNGLVDPLLHLLRNSIDHGIETPKVREQSNKDLTGKIHLSFSRKGSFIEMELRDDGAGINSEKIYQHAIEKGMITPDQEFSKNEILKLILQPGFSTQESINDISGRGVGMDVVNKGVENLKGSLTIASELGQGTVFTIKIPLTLVTSSTLLVSTAGNQVAIPTDTIEQLFYLAPEDVLTRKNDHYIRHEGKELAIESLAAILGWNKQDVDFSKAQTLLLVKGETKLHAVYIDKIIHSREVVIKSLAHFIDNSKGVIGACHLTDGAVAPVINLPQLLTNSEKTHHVIKQLENSNSQTTNKTDTPQILVVDDSLSNRKALSLIIEKTEYDVITAVDGLDALNIMNEKHIDLVFTDLEMPRMTGLELTQAIRAWNEKKKTPIVMVTSRSTNKHRELAKKAGVDDYLTKPVGTDTLLESIETWLKQTTTA